WRANSGREPGWPAQKACAVRLMATMTSTLAAPSRANGAQRRLTVTNAATVRARPPRPTAMTQGSYQLRGGAVIAAVMARIAVMRATPPITAAQTQTPTNCLSRGSSLVARVAARARATYGASGLTGSRRGRGGAFTVGFGAPVPTDVAPPEVGVAYVSV